MDIGTDLSLDDIILKKFPRSANRRGKGGGVRGGRGQQRNQVDSRMPLKHAVAVVKGIQGRRGVQIRREVQGRRGGRGGGGVNKFPIPALGDARLRITQQKRRKITDAREMLGELAKQNDARQKLERLRQLRTRGRTNLSGLKPLTMRGGIMAQTGRNGQLRLSTNKNRGNQRVKPLLQQPGRVISANRRGGLRATIPSLLQMGINMEDERPIIQRTVNNRQSLSSTPMFAMARQRDDYSSWLNSATHDGGIADEDYGLMSRRMLLQSRESNLYATPLPREQPHNFRITARRTSPLQPPEVYYGGTPDMEVGYLEDDITPPQHHNNVARPIRMSAGVKARLDTPAIMRRSMGILAADSKAAHEASRGPTSHRIVVSNLQKSVTNEDIRELFEDIGSLIVSRLVRPGTAEVIYRTREDAEKAVEIYHNRQLDGEPMKCMLVNQRSIPNVGQPSASRNASSSFIGASNKFRSTNKGQKLSVVPDVATIHKALFKRP